MQPRRILVPGLLLFPLFLASCQNSTTSELTGTITYKGAKLTTGEVIVRSTTGLEVSGGIAADGTYTVKNAPRGTLQVKVMCIDEKAANEYFLALAGRGSGEPKGPDGKVRPKGSPVLEMTDFSKIPAKYSDYGTSGLTIEVKDAKVSKDLALD